MEPNVIYQDDDLLVIDKPAGWIVNEAETAKGQNVLQSWLSKMDYPLAKSRQYRSGIVHRLDKETSGILIVAKTIEAFENLQKQFKERKVQKIYTALAHGKIEPLSGTIEAPVGRLPWRRDRFGVLPGGREAVTRYKTLSVFSCRLSEVGLSVGQSVGQTEKPKNITPRTENRGQVTEYSLLELSPKTGRTHQIRIHLKYLGHPVVADEFYAGRKTAREDRKWCPRLFLHASAIKFSHPSTNQPLEFKLPLPPDLRAVMTVLR